MHCTLAYTTKVPIPICVRNIDSFYYDKFQMNRIEMKISGIMILIHKCVSLSYTCSMHNFEIYINRSLLIDLLRPYDWITHASQKWTNQMDSILEKFQFKLTLQLTICNKKIIPLFWIRKFWIWESNWWALFNVLFVLFNCLLFWILKHREKLSYSMSRACMLFNVFFFLTFIDHKWYNQ